MKFLFFICIAIILFSCKPGNKEVTKISDPVAFAKLPVTVEKLPGSITIKGKFHEAWQWTDKTGENILVTSYVEPYDEKEKNEFGEEGQTAILYAAQYITNNDKYDTVWQTGEAIRSCPFDITCHFINDAITVTDLDNDGIAEATFACRLACRSDVSPATMKLIMYEGASKYTLEGFSWLKTSPDDKFTVTENDVNLETLPNFNPDQDYEKMAGRYGTERKFASAPPEFLIYVRKQWMKFVKERLE